MKRISFLLSALFVSSLALATPTDKQIDNIQNSSGGSMLSVPGTGTTFATDTNSISLTNKTMSGASNTFSNIPASAISSGQLTVPNGGTGVATFTTNGILYGNGTGNLLVTAAGSQYQSLQAGSGGIPAFDAVHLDQSAAVTGVLGVPNGGTGLASLTAHDVLVGNGTSALTLISPSTAGFVLTSNGTSADPTFQTLPSNAPTINNSAASPQTVSAAGGISLSAPTYFNYVFIQGTGAGTTTVTATPSITACTTAGQHLVIISESATNLVKLQNDADLSGSQLFLNGPWTSGENSSSPFTLSLDCDGAATKHWVEVSRNN